MTPESENFKENKIEKCSQKCLKTIYELVNTISSEISLEVFNKIMPTLHTTQEVYKHIQNIIMENNLKAVNYGFETMDIANKLDYIEELSRESSTEVTVWRPVTGVVEISAIQERCFSAKKMYLQKQVKALDGETDVLKRTILEKRKMLEHNSLELDKLCIL